MNRGVWFLLCMLLSGSVACGDDSGDSDDGGGSDTTPDAGTAGPADAGEEDEEELVWMPMDAGTGDSSSDSTGSSNDSSNMSSIEGRECAQERDLLPDALLPRCSAATRDCVAGCAENADADACREACLAADDTPAEGMFGLNCSSCIYLQLFGCFDQAGCHEGVAELFCCLADRCADNDDDGCAETMCGDELDAAITCGYFAQESCVNFLGEELGACFADDDSDGGV
ncbi:MAG: hypothetical protein OXT09_19075 [Myxococcales bacterium]|nr:hypothetical protein [Myxococcales bacterium]